MSAVQDLVTGKPPPSIVVAALRDAYAGPPDAPRAADAAIGTLYESLSAPGARHEAVFLYLNIPHAVSQPDQSPEAEQPPRMGTGCAVLWGAPFRRGVVAVETVSWPRLQATILQALGSAEEKQGDAMPAFLRE
jgi:hypothetical protein